MARLFSATVEVHLNEHRSIQPQVVTGVRTFKEGGEGANPRLLLTELLKRAHDWEARITAEDEES